MSPFRSTTSPNVSRALTLALIVAVLLLAFGVLHIIASRAEHRALQPGSIAERAASARFAARLEPWNPTAVHQAKVMRLWEEGQQRLAAGDYNGAVDTLRAAYALDIGNSELLDLFRRAQATQTLATNRKAHLQHAHEGPGGTLRPQDVER
jgi:hypothetical protein